MTVTSWPNADLIILSTRDLVIMTSLLTDCDLVTVTSLLTCDVRISDVIVTVSDCPVPYYFYRFCCKGGRIRLLICPVAVGMGIDIPDVSIVVIWGLLSALLQLWQESSQGWSRWKVKHITMLCIPQKYSLAMWFM